MAFHFDIAETRPPPKAYLIIACRGSDAPHSPPGAKRRHGLGFVHMGDRLRRYRFEPIERTGELSNGLQRRRRLAAMPDHPGRTIGGLCRVEFIGGLIGNLNFLFRWPPGDKPAGGRRNTGSPRGNPNSASAKWVTMTSCTKWDAAL
jgi:hypothetical protein